ncbi:MAG TPA: malto-oligosyltrehalose synthase [Gaiellaceae bacterium]|nr:malto-oligosyltrehalose synthase [Gaiellaceae bacterium]
MADFRCTYRLQLGPELGFAEVRKLVPYLQGLGVSHLYLSPALEARAGSTHGYDVVDPTRLSEALGGEEGFRELCAAGREHGLGVVLDIVPNHMAASDENPFWRDPLWRARFFDLDWRTGTHRRFFDVGELAGVRMEDPEVWETTHAKVVELVGEGLVDGVRIDHPDGLANPRRYLERLREAGIEHVWVEKIVEPGEHLRPEWPVEGTVGYEFLNDVNALFVDPSAEEPLTRFYEEFTGDTRSFADHAAAAKLEQARTAFGDEVDQLRARLPRELDGVDLERALSSFHVYRTYVEPDLARVSEEDRARVAEAQLPEPLVRLLLLEERGHDSFVVRFQQTTPPVMAKGVEDTAFYRWNRLVGLNEVGANPARFSLGVEEFHRANLERAERFPLHLLSTMTHDAKRSADTRARIGALSRCADEWIELVGRWHAATGGLEDPNEEYLVLQTLVGIWAPDDPTVPERLDGYLEKALREAKVNTNWIDQDHEHEGRVRRWVRRLLRDQEFLESFDPFARRVAADAERDVLGMVLLKLTCPGVPDVYQGDELPFLALVDPDNRRPVDWALRRRLLGAADEPEKLRLIRLALGLRARRPEPFGGGYEPLDAGSDTCAFLRGSDVKVAVALRGELREPDAPGEWRDVFRAPTLLLAERV